MNELTRILPRTYIIIQTLEKDKKNLMKLWTLTFEPSTFLTTDHLFSTPLNAPRTKKLVNRSKANTSIDASITPQKLRQSCEV